MNVSTSCRYHFLEYKWAIIAFYLVFFILSGISKIYFMAEPDSSFSGLEAGTVFFLFISGISSFHSVFLFHIQCGSTRKTQFCGWLLFSALICTFMTIFNTVIVYVMSALSLNIDSPVFYFSESSPILGTLTATMMLFCINLFFLQLGYFFAISFYRLGFWGKWLFGSFLVVSFFLIISSDSFLPNLSQPLQILQQAPVPTPVLISVILFSLAAALAGLCRLMTKNAPCQTQNSSTGIFAL